MKNVWKQLLSAVLVFTLLVSVGIAPAYANAATKPALSTSKVSVYIGDSKTVTVKNTPKGAGVSWSTEDASVATVVKGQITGAGKGSTKIVCKLSYKNASKKYVTEYLKVSVTVKSLYNTKKDQSNLTKSHKSANGITTKDNGQMRTDLSSKELTKVMGLAWNLGNSLEACGIVNAASITDYETGWGNTVTTQKTIDGIKKYGFNTIRIPVAWSNMISDDGKYTIDDALFDRVETVINYALNNGMYVILNIHYDSGWWGQFGSADEAVRAEAWKRYISFWEQISNRYKEYSDRLIFESGNEEIGDRLNDKIDGVAGVLTAKEQYTMSKEINQKFVDIVRASGGNNESRHLLIAGFNTDIVKTCDSQFVMPTDLKKNGNNKLSISVHYYTPSTYCIASSDLGWGFLDTWGTASDIKELHKLFDKMTKFTDAGYGVIIGEYGVTSPNKNGVAAFHKEVVSYSAELGFCPVIWDNGLWYNRINCEFKYKDIAQVFIDASGSKTKAPADAATTGIPKLQVADESTLKLMYTWEGKFIKNDGTNKYQYYEQKSCSEGLKVSNNSWDYYLYLYTDWESMKQPYIKVYVQNDDISKNASLQFGYVDEKDGIMDNGNDIWNDQVTFQATDGWHGKCIMLNKADLIKYDALFLSSDNGFTVTKIEIYDLADK